MIQILFLPFAVGLSFISVFPNILDKYFCTDQKMKTCAERCRHPLTHNPIILLFLFLVFLGVNTENQIFCLLVRGIFLSIGSHLILDIFSEEGIPIGFTSTLFSQDRRKNYLFNQHTRPRLKLRLHSSLLSREERGINHRIVLLCKGVVVLACLLILIDNLRDPLHIDEIHGYDFDILLKSVFQERGVN